MPDKTAGDPQAASAPPLVSVCIPNHNGEAMIAGCIRSVIDQRGAPTTQIIVHDDASTDRSLEIIRTFPQVELLTSTRNVGYCASNNRMAEHARGEYLLLLNNDAELLPDALNTLVQASGAAPRKGILTLAQHDYRTHTLVDRGQLLDPFMNPIPNLDAGRVDVAMVSGSCLWIPRALWQQTGGLPDYFGNLAEDLYLCLYSRALGYPVSVAGNSGYLHRIGATLGGGKVVSNSLSTTYRRRAGSERNKTFCMVLFYPLPALLLVLPAHLVSLLLEGILLAAATRSMRPLLEIYLAVLPALARNLRTLVVQRRVIQERRICGTLAFFRPFRCFPRKFVLWWRHGMPELR